MARVRTCEKCGAMANVTRVKKTQTVECPTCGHKTIKNIVRKGPGG